MGSEMKWSEGMIKFIERTNKSNRVEFIIPIFLNCSACFWRHTVHHQELKDCNCSLRFYIRFWLPAAAMVEPSQRPATKNVCKTRGCNYSFWAPDDGVSPETCWAIKKHWNNKFYYTVASCWFFLWVLYLYTVCLLLGVGNHISITLLYD